MPFKNLEHKQMRSKEYLKENKERIRAYQKEYREKNKEKVANRQREWYLTNREKVLAKNKEDRPKINVRQNERRKDNADYHKQYQHQHPEYAARTLLRRRFGKDFEIPPALLEARTALLLTRRAIKELKNEEC